ncbi:MAG: DegT/DnrJ/EryC1/StrS family aminotransferase [Myxococcota bacterium]
MSPRKVDFFRHSLGAEELSSIEETLHSLFLTLGPRVGAFEKRFAELLGVPHVIGTSSCSTGLLVALAAMDVGPGDEIITTPMTFCSTSNAVLHLGATPVFADIDPRTGMLDPAEVKRKLTDKTKGIIVVHLYGQLADMPALRAIADDAGVFLMEDAAHAIDAARDGVRTAHLGDATAFSFYATKEITSGDGGAIAVHDDALAQRLRRVRNHGVSKDAAARHGGLYQHWDMVDLGFKAAMTDVEAALLLPQLDRIEDQRRHRQALTERYEAALAAHSDVQLVERSGQSGHHLMVALVPRGLRDRVLTQLGTRGVGCAVNYRSVHTLKYYRDRFGYEGDAFPISHDWGDRCVSLPLWHQMPLEDVDYVVSALDDAIGQAKREA